jgi:FAD/FMN-containing dehydrogenase
VARVTATGTGHASGLVDELVGVVGERHVLVDPDMTAGYAVDWTGRFRGSTPAVVRPGSVEEVADVVRLLARRGIPLVAQGGNTGMVGGSVPTAGEVVLSTRRLDRLEPVDALAGQVTAGAGVVLDRLHEHAEAAGFTFGVDLGARSSCTVGGMIATNAGGIHVLRYGSMRAQVVGIEAVLGDGSVVEHLAGLEKDNTGYDLAGLMCGSEGTLGIVTKARLRLRPRFDHVVTAMVPVGSMAAAMEVAATLRATVANLNAVEMVGRAALDLVADHLGVAPPVRAEVVLVVEAAAHHDPSEELAAGLEACGELAGEPAVAVDGAARRALWRFREGVTEAVNAAGIPHKLDVTLPAAALAEFADHVGDAVHRLDPSTTTYLFGHLGDGNVHVNVIGLAPGHDADDVDRAVFELVVAHHGSISAEHGIGTAKRDFLHLNRSPAELAAFAALRRAFDPAGILNPNVLVPT